MLKKIAILLIKFYKTFISPVLPHSCRFYPTCSNYTLIAIERYGIFRGGILGAKRILRCHPFNPGGYDPVPILGEMKKVKINRRKKK